MLPLVAKEIQLDKSKLIAMGENEGRRKGAGRPAKAVKREIRIALRLSRPEHFILAEKARKAGVTTSELLRQLAITSSIKPRLTEEETVYVRRLIGQSNNLNQMAKLMHQEGLLKGFEFFQKWRAEIDDLLQKLK